VLALEVEESVGGGVGVREAKPLLEEVRESLGVEEGVTTVVSDKV